MLRSLGILAGSVVCVGAVIAQAPAQQGQTAADYVATAQHLEAEGHLADALEAFEAALKLSPTDATARQGEIRIATRLALVDRRGGDMDGALVLLQRANNAVPDDAGLLLDLGMQQDAMRRYKDAEQTLSQAHKAHPDDSQITYALARVELDLQKLPPSEALFREYLKQKPDDASAHYGLGRLLHMAQRNDEAEKELQRSIAIQPVQTESYYLLGEIRLDEQKNDEARELFKRVLERNPAHGGALTGLGILAFRAKDYSEAEHYLQQGVTQAYDYQPAHYYYGLTLAKLGKTDQSKQELALATEMAEREQANSVPGNH